MGLFEYIKDNQFPTPVTLEIELCKVIYDRMRNGKDARYFRIYIDGHDVTTMTANLLGAKISKAKDTYGCLIIHGSGSDMAYEISYRVCDKAIDAGMQNMFDRNYNVYYRKGA